MENPAPRRRHSRKLAPLLLLAACASALSGCVAILVPVAAGSLIAKKQIDAAKRAKRAEATMTGATAGAEQDIPNPNAGPTPETDTTAEILPAPETLGDKPAAQSTSLSAADRLLSSGIRHPYREFVHYSLEQAARRFNGLPVRSAVLIDNISLASPKTIDCGQKPLAIILDLDEAKNATAPGGIKPDEFAVLMETLRESGIRIAWISDDASAASEGRIAMLSSSDNPALKPSDLVMLGRRGGLRKQEQRWELAKDHCILAIAGDRRADFDELYDYLRQPELAIRLDGMWNRGWFELPAPTLSLGNAAIQPE
jgi:hypothetical protein